MRRRYNYCLLLAVIVLIASMLAGCSAGSAVSTGAGESTVDTETAIEENDQTDYHYEDFLVERNGVSLYLSCMKQEGTEPDRNILLMHGVTYSSHEFDIDYQDYSLVRRLARDRKSVV